jgi:hypothetical protein
MRRVALAASLVCMGAGVAFLAAGAWLARASETE